jgi:SAM-dependent methyltransferase
MVTWHDSDEFWGTTAPFMFTGARWDSAQDEVDQVIRLLGVEPGAQLLDLCCGPGRHSLALAGSGFRVTGVDRTAVYLEKARKKAEENKLSVEFIQEDIRTFNRPSAFDASFSLFTSFGYFENPKENQRVLLNLYESLKEGGKLLLDVMGKEVLARIFQERDWIEQDGVYFLQEREVSRDWGWMVNRWILLQGAQKREFEVSHWLYSATELSLMVREAGFGVVEVFGSLDGIPYDNNARRLVVVAQK